MISNELIQYLSNSIVTPDRIKGVPNYDNISTRSDDLVFVQVRKYADDFFSEGKTSTNGCYCRFTELDEIHGKLATSQTYPKTTH
jgi:hypothetical protein